MARRPGRVKSVDEALEADFRKINRSIARCHRELRRLLPQRDQTAWALFNEHGYTQRDIADLANEVADPRLSEDAFQKAFSRLDDKDLARSA
jgi:hypothetical protein